MPIPKEFGTMVEPLLLLALLIVLGWPLGRYLAAVMRGDAMRSDALFHWIERPLYALLGTRPEIGMSWRDLGAGR